MGNHAGTNPPLVPREPPTTARRPHGERRNRSSREQLVERILAEFREMPCLRLTRAQAQRLFGLRADVCERIIGKLMQDGLLRLDTDGRYATTEPG